jgi:AraC-like DNA-binding protein
MIANPTGSGGQGLERSCDATAGDWLRQTEPVGGLELLQARLQRLAYRRHRHDTYAISLTAAGVQAFAYRGAHHVSTPGHVVVLHPDEPHDGYAGTEAGFAYLQLYVEPAVVVAAVRALGGRAGTLPFVPEPVTTNTILAAAVRAAFRHDRESLAVDDLIVRVAAGLLHADPNGRLAAASFHVDSAAVERVRQLLDTETTRVVNSRELEAVSGLTRYELARQFRAVIGTSPYRYSVMRRLRAARALIARRRPLVDIALATGFADQAHFTRRFTAAFGLTPGQYASLTANGMRGKS